MTNENSQYDNPRIERTFIVEETGERVYKDNRGNIKVVGKEQIDKIKNRLEQIDPSATHAYVPMGQPFGISLEHCIYLGIRHCPNFSTRVKYYTSRKPEELPSNDQRSQFSRLRAKQLVVCIDFYAEK